MLQTRNEERFVAARIPVVREIIRDLHCLAELPNISEENLRQSASTSSLKKAKL